MLFSLQCSEPQKLLHIAQELLHTEETYVRRLHLLDQVAHTAGPFFMHVRVSVRSGRGRVPISWRWLGLTVGM